VLTRISNKEKKMKNGGHVGHHTTTTTLHLSLYLPLFFSLLSQTTSMVDHVLIPNSTLSPLFSLSHSPHPITWVCMHFGIMWSREKLERREAGAW
jgi:hypothetical protein